MCRSTRLTTGALAKRNGINLHTVADLWSVQSCPDALCPGTLCVWNPELKDSHLVCRGGPRLPEVDETLKSVTRSWWRCSMTCEHIFDCGTYAAECTSCRCVSGRDLGQPAASFANRAGRVALEMNVLPRGIAAQLSHLQGGVETKRR